MSESTSQLKIGAVLDGSFEQTTTTVKRKIGELGTAATSTGKSLAGMGDGTAQSAQKVEQSTKSMIQSIQRTTAATEAGDKSTRAYQESLARMRGVDVAALKPYLDQLDSAKNKAALASTANESFAASFAGIRNAALIAAAAVGSFAIAFKKINDGVDALNDLKDATGASIENISGLEDVARRSGASFDTVSTSLIKFNGILKDAKPGSEAEQAMKALGLSISDLKRLDPAEALLKAATAMNGFADDGNKARIAQELFGKSLKDVAPFLKDLAEKGALIAKVTTEQADEAEKFNKELFNMQKNITDVARDMSGPMVTAINEVIQKFKEGREAGKGFFETGWQNYKDNVGAFYGMKKGDSGASGSWDSGATGSWGDAVKPSIGPLPDMAAAKAAAAAVKKAIEDQNRELKEQAKLLAELSGLSGTFAEDWDRLTTIFKSGKLSLEGLTKAQADLLAKQPFQKAKHDAEVKASKIMQDEYAQEVEALNALSAAQVASDTARTNGIQAVTTYADSIKEQNEYSQLEFSLMGSSATAREIALGQYRVELDLKKQIEAIRANVGFDEDQRMVQRARARAAAAQATAGVEAKVYTDEWKKTSDSINSTLTDALMRGFESGKDFAKNMRDTIVNMFKTMILRPIISAVMSPISGAITGAMGLSGAAQAAGTGSSLLSGAGTLATLASSAASWGTAAGAGFMATIGGSTIGGGAAAGMLATGGAAGAGTAGMIGALGPYALAALAVLAIHKMTQGETRNGAAYGVGLDGMATKLQGPSGGEIASKQAREMFNVTKSSIEGMLTAFGSKAVLTGFTAGLESSTNGKGFAYSTGKINGVSFGDTNTFNNSRGDKSQEQALKDYQKELSQSVLEALQVTVDIPGTVAKLIKDGLNGSEVKDLTLEATSAILLTVETLSKQVNTFNSAMASLPFESLKNLSFDTAAGLIAAAGGFEKLDANLGGFYQNFFTAAEQTAQLTSTTAKAFEALGLVMPTLDEGARAAYRALVTAAEGQDLSVEANRKAYVGLLALQGPMNELAPAFVGLAAVATDAVAKINDAAKEAAKASLEAATNNADKAYATLVRAVGAQRRLIDIAVNAAQEQISAITSVFDALKTNVQSLYGSVESTSAMQSTQGQAFIAQALATAKASGYLPDSAALADAIAGAMSGVNGTQYTSQSDADFARLVLAGKLSALQGISGDQLTEAQKALKSAEAQSTALDGILDAAKQQIDAANGIDTSVLSVVDAVKLVNDSVKTLITLQASQADAGRLQSIKAYVQSVYSTATPAAEKSGLEKISATAKEYGVSMSDVARSMGLTLDNVQALFKRFGVTWQSSLGIINANTTATGAALPNSSMPGTTTVGGATAPAQAPQGYFTATNLGGWGATRDYITDAAQVAKLDSIKAYVGSTFDGTAQSLAAIASAAASYGVTQAEIAQAIGYTESDIAKLFSASGIPAFAVGTNYVSRDMIAQIHEGEAIVPKAYNPAAGGSGNNARLESLVEGLTQEVQRLQAIVNDGNKNTRRAADAVNGNPEMPMLVQTV